MERHLGIGFPAESTEAKLPNPGPGGGAESPGPPVHYQLTMSCAVTAMGVNGGRFATLLKAGL